MSARWIKVPPSQRVIITNPTTGEITGIHNLSFWEFLIDMVFIAPQWRSHADPEWQRAALRLRSAFEHAEPGQYVGNTLSDFGKLQQMCSLPHVPALSPGLQAAVFTFQLAVADALDKDPALTPPEP
jgi:hypothetical protein